MMTAKEIFLELLKPDGQPDRLLRQYEALHMCLGDPINTYLRGNRKRGTVSVDRWGTTISFPEDAPGPMPVTHDGLAVCPDVTRWRETVHAPDLAANCTEGWEAVRQQAREACGQEKLLAGFMGTGIFEQCHFLMGFEDTLTALYEHPQEMHELIEYITEYRLGYVKLLIDNLQPDVIFSHDDWGTKNALFVLMGGMGAAIDRADASPEEIRDYAKNVLASCGPLGHFIPSITYGLAETVYPHVDRYIDEAIDGYNRQVHLPKFDLPPVPRRVLAQKESGDAVRTAESGDNALDRVAAALQRGQQKKVLALCREALDQGIAAADILSGGLMRGMDRLGVDFSAGIAFVPEMLMAARCMQAALELLRPRMAGSGTEKLGRACIGTVRGDMHDIGKNLVKIMMEGSGIEVVDLGVDVAPEKFVEAALHQNCGIIACSSLLTTTMQEMRDVVRLAEEMGIRGRVKILVGGAPISQSFCDEIGADAYTEDAASAAREAASLLRRGQ